MATTTKEEVKINTNEINKDLLDRLNQNNTTDVINYGLHLQNQLGDQTGKLLANIKACDTDKIGDELVELVQALDNNQNKKKTFFGIFKQKVKHTIDEQKSIEKLIDDICAKLKNDQLMLKNMLKDMAASVQSGREFIKDISTYIYTGKYKLSQLENTEIPALQTQIANAPDHITKEQLENKLIDLNSYKQQLHQRISDLQGSKTLMQEQIVEIQTTADANRKLYSQITRTLNNTVATWKSQIGLSVFLEQQGNVLRHTEHVNQLTNKLIKNNSEVFKEQSIDIAKKQNKPEIDYETLETAQKNITEAIETINKISKESNNKSDDTLKKLQELEEKTKKLQTQVEHSNNITNQADKDLGINNKDNEDIF